AIRRPSRTHPRDQRIAAPLRAGPLPPPRPVKENPMRNLLRALPLLALLFGCGDISQYPEKLCNSRGDLGCECGPRDTCKRGPDGELLACVDGLCEVAVC